MGEEKFGPGVDGDSVNAGYETQDHDRKKAIEALNEIHGAAQRNQLGHPVIRSKSSLTSHGGGFRLVVDMELAEEMRNMVVTYEPDRFDHVLISATSKHRFTREMRELGEWQVGYGASFRFDLMVRVISIKTMK